MRKLRENYSDSLKRGIEERFLPVFGENNARKISVRCHFGALKP
jgi:hypothetical protein